MRPALRRPLFAAMTVGALLLLLEGGLRMLVAPSDRSYGIFLGRELPPVDLIPYDGPPAKSDRDAWHGDLVVDGRQITIGDLWGFQRDDPVLGYVAKENTVSRNGWWQSNNIGARDRRDTTAAVPEGKQRILVFGDSYAQATRVKQEQAWPALLESDSTESVNLGVDGYSMAQSYLRYRQLRQRVAHDLVLLVFVPIKDLWRDVNTIRSLAKDWDYYPVMPRFVLERGRLVLVKSPYRHNSDVFTRNGTSVSDELKAHLEAYDRFYFEAEFREPRFAGRLVLSRIALRAWLVYRKRSLYAVLDADSEAARVTRAIFREMAGEVERDGARFVLVYLPSHRDLELLRKSRRYAREWNRLVDETCRGAFACLDLSSDLLAAPPGTLDEGYDGSHYGPRANRRIADLVGRYLAAEGFVEDPKAPG